MPKNYYLILGVASDAGIDEIKAAFRRRALELHPDTSGLGSGPFREVEEAYRVLANPEERSQYDRRRLAPAPPLRRPARQGEPFRPAKTFTGFGKFSPIESFAGPRPSLDERLLRSWIRSRIMSRPGNDFFP